MKKQITLPQNTIIALQSLGKCIKTTRIKQGITATAMADMMDTTRVTLGSIESGQPSVSMGHYLKAMSILGIDMRLTNILIEEVAKS